jgi:hypothetical protein
MLARHRSPTSTAASCHDTSDRTNVDGSLLLRAEAVAQTDPQTGRSISRGTTVVPPAGKWWILGMTPTKQAESRVFVPPLPAQPFLAYFRNSLHATRYCGGSSRHWPAHCSLSVQGRLGKRGVRVDVVVWVADATAGCCMSVGGGALSPLGRPARRAERGALDRRRAGAGGRCVRAGAQPYLGPRPGVAPGRRHDG